MNEDAYEMQDGEAVPCRYDGPERRRLLPSKPILVRPPPRMWTKRETRQRARKGRRFGLRLWPSGANPRRYDPPGPIELFAPYVAEWAHQLRDPNDNSRFFLYLPKSEPLTEAHLFAVERALLRPLP